jgi:hypothetical protein
MLCCNTPVALKNLPAFMLGPIPVLCDTGPVPTPKSEQSFGGVNPHTINQKLHGRDPRGDRGCVQVDFQSKPVAHGIHLLREMSDRMEYARVDGRNRVTLWIQCHS